MARRVMRVALGVLASVLAARAAGTEAPVMPPALVEHARAQGCRPVIDFHAGTGAAGRPFVYGYVPGPAEESAAYWCERGERTRPAFRLVLMIEDDRHELARCPRYIEWGDRIGGLSILNDDTITLDDFVPLEHRAARPPRGTRLRHPAIRSEHEGAGVVFYCHEGSWFVRMER